MNWTVGNVYRTRGGEYVRITGFTAGLIDVAFVSNDEKAQVSPNGNSHHGKPEWDLMEMVRTSNIPKSSGQSCG
jgi:hypothetical protein